jgi:hypothetical protein
MRPTSQKYVFDDHASREVALGHLSSFDPTEFSIDELGEGDDGECYAVVSFADVEKVLIAFCALAFPEAEQIAP